MNMGKTMTYKESQKFNICLPALYWGRYYFYLHVQRARVERVRSGITVAKTEIPYLGQEPLTNYSSYQKHIL